MTLILGLRNFYLPFWRNLSASLLQFDFWPSRSYSFHVIFKRPFGPCGCSLFDLPSHEKHKSQTILQRFPIILFLILVFAFTSWSDQQAHPGHQVPISIDGKGHFQSKLQEVEGPLWTFTCQKVVTLITSEVDCLNQYCPIEI